MQPGRHASRDNLCPPSTTHVLAAAGSDIAKNVRQAAVTIAGRLRQPRQHRTPPPPTRPHLPPPRPPPPLPPGPQHPTVCESPNPARKDQIDPVPSGDGAGVRILTSQE